MHRTNMFLLSTLILLCFVATSSAKDFTSFTKADDYKLADLDEILGRPRPEQSKFHILFNQKLKFHATLQSYADACDTTVLKIIARMGARGKKEDFDDYRISKCITVKSPQGVSVKLHIKDQMSEILSKEISLGDKIIIYGDCLYMVKSDPGIIVEAVMSDKNDKLIQSIEKGNLRKTVVLDKNAQLIEAARKGNLSDVQTALADGANVNAEDRDGRTALLLASGGYVEIVKFLLDKGADVNVNHHKLLSTPLILASHTGHTEIVKLLLDKGADINVTDSFRDTALIAASSGGGHTETVKLLLDRGADVNINPTNGVTALMSASGRGATEITKLLLDGGADVNAKTNNDFTALMMASIEGRTEIVKLLLNRGADVNIKNNLGVDALMWAKKKDRKEIIEILKKAGAKE